VWSGSVWVPVLVHGTYTNANPAQGSSSSGLDWSDTQTVTFPIAYPAPPIVQLEEVGGSAVQWAQLATVTKTGFTFRVVRIASYPSAINTNWYATPA